MGDQLLSRMVQSLVISGVDLGSLVSLMLAPGAQLDDLIMDWSPQLAVPA
jgi:hypothetical protein